MTPPVEILDAAQGEVVEAHHFYQRRSARAADEFLGAVRDAIQRIAAAPDSHPVEYRQAKWVRVRRFPFRLVYTVDSRHEKVIVIALVHTSRRSGYWVKRYPEN